MWSARQERVRATARCTMFDALQNRQRYAPPLALPRDTQLLHTAIARTHRREVLAEGYRTRATTGQMIVARERKTRSIHIPSALVELWGG